MMSDILCRVTKMNGLTEKLWLPSQQVEAMTDLESPVGAAINEALGVIAVDPEPSTARTAAAKVAA